MRLCGFFSFLLKTWVYNSAFKQTIAFFIELFVFSALSCDAFFFKNQQPEVFLSKFMSWIFTVVRCEVQVPACQYREWKQF